MANGWQRKREAVDFYAEKLKELSYSGRLGRLSGLSSDARIIAWAKQIVDSIRRNEYCRHIGEKRYSNSAVINPNNAAFNPLKAAVEKKESGDLDEACWLIFMATHFGKHTKRGWRLVRKIYGLCGSGILDWQTINENPSGFSDWLRQNQRVLQGNEFSNHRKYETLSPNSVSGPPAVFASYANWINKYGGWQSLLNKIRADCGNDPKAVFKELYRLMNIKRFGRLGKFDYLAMLGELGIMDIEPDSAYLEGATGPLRGARLLFGGNPDLKIAAEDLDKRVVQLGDYLGANMQVMEDSLCNWQKNPERYVAFR